MQSSKFSQFKTTPKINNVFTDYNTINRDDNKSDSTDSLENAIISAIQEYDRNIDDPQNQQKQQLNPQSSHNNSFQNPLLKQIQTKGKHPINIPIKKNNKPLRMFKDMIDLKKQNTQKHLKIKQLSQKNQYLKQDYYKSLNNNCRLQGFLKVIQFTFKNDESNQKANQTLLRAKKNLQRQEKESRQYVRKIWKKPKYNTMKQLKLYLRAIQQQHQLQIDFYKIYSEQNQKLRSICDLNRQNLEIFNEYQQKIKTIMGGRAQQLQNNQQEYKKQKILIKIHLLTKQINLMRKNNNDIDSNIKKKLLEKQGIEYQTEILKNRQKQKNKKMVKESERLLVDEVHAKKIRIMELRKQYKEKSKTNQYISKWTKQLKLQLEKLKANHSNIKQQYDAQINKLSNEIEQWNRKYKAELVEDQVMKKTSKNSQLPTKVNKKQNINTRTNTNTNIISVNKKNKKITRQQINQIRKIIMFRILEDQKYANCQQFIHQEIIMNRETCFISFEDLRRSIMGLLSQKVQVTQNVNKFIKYVMEDYQIQSKQTIKKMQGKLCNLVLKNLLASELTSQNIQETKKQLYNFYDKNYDNFRQSLWESSGKTLNFSIVTLDLVFRKYFADEVKIMRYVQYFQFSLWSKFNTIFMHKLLFFQLVCEDILGKKLVKDQKRIYKKIIKNKPQIQ